ncbi:hypothetical protein A9K66_24570 [Mesorhizobium sp. AA23]|nr:hypothetical protein A9K66_24570 [Mesorhizobium sp. AA23]
MSGSVGAMAAGPAAALVALDERAAQELFERWQPAQEPAAALAQGGGGSVLHGNSRTSNQTGPTILAKVES